MKNFCIFSHPSTCYEEDDDDFTVTFYPLFSVS